MTSTAPSLDALTTWRFRGRPTEVRREPFHDRNYLSVKLDSRPPRSIETESRAIDAARVSSSPLLLGDSPREKAPFAGTLSNPGLNSASLRREELDRVFHGGG